MIFVIITEDDEEAKDISKITDYKLALNEIFNMLRNYNKYSNDEFLKKPAEEVIEKIYSDFLDILNNKGIDV